jgi:hypothetical protein
MFGIRAGGESSMASKKTASGKFVFGVEPAGLAERQRFEL